MTVLAAVMTGPSVGAIATIQLVGDGTAAVLREVFRRAGAGPLEPKPGQILLGHIVDDAESIDQVTIGCEDVHSFAIHCHGNPLIVERIVSLLQRHGAEVLSAEALLTHMLERDRSGTTIELEAQLAMATVKTLEGAEILAHQMTTGLLRKVRQWQDSLDSISPARIAAEARQVLADSEPARLILSGCTIVLVGPPNTGKSTLLNALAGRDKAIVTDIPGTTRDWVSAEVHIPPLAATIIDTAGLDGVLAAALGGVDRVAQQRSVEILDRADLILLVLDRTQPADAVPAGLAEALAGRETLTVLNKADLSPSAAADRTPQSVTVSAKTGAGVDGLIAAIHATLGVTRLAPNCPIAFMDRQRRLLAGIRPTSSASDAKAVISELLTGPWGEIGPSH